MLFWQTGVRKGANVFNRKVDSDLIKAAKEYKIGFIRLALTNLKLRNVTSS